MPGKLPVKANNYGGTLGGPIAQEQGVLLRVVRRLQARPEPVHVLQRAGCRRCAAGDFSSALNTNGTLQTIYNPFTGGANGVGRAAVRRTTRFPPSMINPIALKVLKLFPLPNTAGTGAGGLTNNYQRQEDRTVDRENYDVKVNWNRTSAHQIWGKFSYMNAVVDDLTNYLGPDPNADGRRRLHQGLSGHRRARPGRSRRRC